jgi:hypothetical protein
MTNTVNTTPAVTHPRSPQDNQIAVPSDGDAATQGISYDLGPVKDSFSIATASTSNNRNQSAAVYIPTSSDVDADPLVAFDFNDPFWDQPVAPLCAVAAGHAKH